MKNSEALNNLNSLVTVSQATNVFPVSVGYKIIKNMKALKNALEPYEEMRNKIVTKYDKSGLVKEDNPEYQDCLKDISELNMQETDVELDTISIDDIKDLEIPMNILTNLSCMIE
ncbi:MAG: hypothetical protein KA953_00540 [Lachnospiraceae bacterium]|nr:hypothetical protein [Lachnospiraceae bacterium]